MHLRSLPPDLWRPILSYLSIFELVKLQQTFDRQIHRALSFPGVIETLLIPDDSVLPTKHIFELLPLVRNVTRLLVDHSVRWPTDAIPLFKTLNPLEFSFSYPLFHQSAIEKMFSEIEADEADGEASLTRHLTPAIFPKLNKLTPRLETLILAHDTRFVSGDYYTLLKAEWTEPVNSRLFFRFPASLTKLVLSGTDDRSATAILRQLPSHLQSLTLSKIDFNIDFSLITSMFPMLEGLHIHAPFYKARESLFPDNLTHVGLHAVRSSDLNSLLQNSNIKRVPLSSFSITIPADDNQPIALPLGELLPVTVDSASITLTGTSYIGGMIWAPASLPAHLTSLILDSQRLHPSLFTTLSALKSLSTLTLRSGLYSWTGPKRIKDPSRALLVASHYLLPHLPKQLTRLVVLQADEDISSSAIADLPPSLTFLSMPSFLLSKVKKLRKCLPNCRLRISNPILMWSSKNGRYLRSKLLPWSTVVELDAWMNELRHHFSALKVDFALTFEETTRLSAHYLAEGVTEFICGGTHPFGGIRLSAEPIPDTLNNALPTLSKLILRIRDPPNRRVSLKQLPPTLTHLELFIAKGFVFNLAYNDPVPAFHYLATNGSASLEDLYCWKLSPKTKHLDVPNWSVLASALESCSLIGFTKLCIDIKDLKDVKVISFLCGDRIDAMTRSNMRVSLSYRITGRLVLDTDVSMHEEVTWDWIRLRTAETLEAQLLALVPLSKAHSPERDRIGSVITRLTGDLSRLDRMTLPASTQLAHLDEHPALLKTGWTFETNWVATNLVRLEAKGIWNLHWLDLLPPTLLYLKIAVKDYFGLKTTTLLPPALRVLIMEHSAGFEPKKSRAPTELPLNLTTLPSSLRYLAIVGQHWKPSSADLPADPNAKLDSLRNLKSLLISGTSTQMALDFIELLSLESINRVDAITDPGVLVQLGQLTSDPKVHWSTTSQGTEAELFRVRIELLWNED